MRGLRTIWLLPRPIADVCEDLGLCKESSKIIRVLTRTTPDLSTISCMTLPFLPITLPTSARGTLMDSSAYSSIARAARTDSLVCKRTALFSLYVLKGQISGIPGRWSLGLYRDLTCLFL